VRTRCALWLSSPPLIITHPLQVAPGITWIMLNTLVYSPSHCIDGTGGETALQSDGSCRRPTAAAALPRDPLGQFAWLGEQLGLAAARNGGKGVAYIVGHVPPGVSDYYTALWQEQYALQYQSTLEQHGQTVVAGQFWGHIHTDQFRVSLGAAAGADLARRAALEESASATAAAAAAAGDGETTGRRLQAASAATGVTGAAAAAAHSGAGTGTGTGTDPATGMSWQFGPSLVQPALSPISMNNPAFRVYEYGGDRAGPNYGRLLDYVQHVAALTDQDAADTRRTIKTPAAELQWDVSYRATEEYGLAAPLSNSGFRLLAERLRTNATLWRRFRRHHKALQEEVDPSHNPACVFGSVCAARVFCFLQSMDPAGYRRCAQNTYLGVGAVLLICLAGVIVIIGALGAAAGANRSLLRQLFGIGDSAKVADECGWAQQEAERAPILRPAAGVAAAAAGVAARLPDEVGERTEVEDHQHHGVRHAANSG
jgi:hypothetical protein